MPPIEQTKQGEQPEDKTITIDADAPLADLEITIPADEVAGAAETKGGDKEGGEPEPAKKQQGRFQRKINQATARANEAETTADRLRRENDELKQRVAKTEGDLVVADRAAFNNHAQNVEARLKQSKQELTAAHEAGDAAKIADATADVSKWGTEQARVDRWKETHPEPAADTKRTETPPDDRTTKQTQQKQEFSPDLKDFLGRNPWFTPNTDDFDKDMHVEARDFAGALERKLERQGKKAEIGTPGYYAQIEKHMKDEFPDYEWDEGAEPPTKSGLPKMTADQRQIPARSASNGNGAPSAGSQKITLTGEQRGFVKNLIDQGAYGPVNPATNKPWTQAEGEMRFARQVLVDKENQRQKAGG